MLAKSSDYGFTHVQAVDKVTDIASWQAAVSQGWPIYSVFCEHERCRFSSRLRTCTQLNQCFALLRREVHRLLPAIIGLMIAVLRS